MSLSSQREWLSEDNLIPVYLIEDKLQSNFKKTNNFIYQSTQKHNKTFKDIALIKDAQEAMKQNFQQKMQQMEKKIIREISMELEGRIAIVIGKSIAGFSEKIDEREKGMGAVKDQFVTKLQKLKDDLKYEITMENQKQFVKQDRKIQDIVKKVGTTAKFDHDRQGNAAKVAKSMENLEKEGSKDGNEGKWREQHHMILGLEDRIKGLEEFSVNVDKRVYNNITSLKDSWKELGAELLENKKTMIKKFDELRIEFIKLKGLKQFSITPDKIQDQFKRRLYQKFTDIYQLLSITLTKNQYESTYDRLSSRIGRHDDEFLEIRKQLAINNQYFTFYANNADQDDLKKDIQKVVEQFQQDNGDLTERIREVSQRVMGNFKETADLDKTIKKIKEDFQAKIGLIDNMNKIVRSVKDRIQDLEDFNKFGPEKLQKIHNVLDNEFSATQRQLLQNKEKKQGLTNVEQSQRELRIEMAKMKDEMFLLTSQNHVKEEELSLMKKNYKELELKMVKMKGESEEAMVSRKPWVCLSCDRQDKQKQQAKKQLKTKRPQPFKGFPQHQRSQKLLKPPTTPPFEQRFEVYDKFREKYLSDTIKLPEIIKEKLKDKESSSIYN